MHRPVHVPTLRARPIALALAALFVAVGCGKAPNVHNEVFLEFPHRLPQAPVELDQQVPSWTTGHPIAATSDEIFVVDRDNGVLVVLDADSLDIIRKIAVGDMPEQVVLGPDLAAWVTVRHSGRVVRIPAGADAVDTEVVTGYEPYAIALSKSGDTGYVTVRGSDEIVRFDTTTGGILERSQRGESLRGIAVTTDGDLTVVQESGPALHIDVMASGSLGLAHQEATLRRGTPTDFELNFFRSQELRTSRAVAVAVRPGGGTLVTHLQTDPGTIQETLGAFSQQDFDGGAEVSSGYGGGGSGGSQVMPFDVPIRPVDTAVTPIDDQGTPGALDAKLPVQDPISGEPMIAQLALPSDIHHHPTWSLAFVTGEGTDNVLVLNTSPMDPMGSPVALIDVGMAPRGIAFSPNGEVAYVLNSHSFTVSEIHLQPLFAAERVEQIEPDFGDDMFDHGFGFGGGMGMESAPIMMDEEGEGQRVEPQPEPAGAAFMQPLRLKHSREVPFGDDPATEAVRRGRRVFTFARNPRLSHAGRFACATCHLEGNEDKLVWVTNGPRQTIALAGRVSGTGPFNWMGTKESLQTNMNQTVGRMGGDGLNGNELADLEQFLLHGLQAPPNPHLNPEGLTGQQQLGKAVFARKDVGCGTCHTGDALTDGNSYDLEISSEEERLLRQLRIESGEDLPPAGHFNTPSLKGLWHTAPYLHNGSAPTLEDVLTMTDGTMGKTGHLSQVERDALIAYLKTL